MTDAQRIADLEEQVAYLQRELGLVLEVADVEILRHRLGLERMQARLVLRLYAAKSRIVPRALLGDLLDRGTDNTVSVHVARIRRRLGRDAIQTAAGLGYRISPTLAARIDQLRTAPGVAA